ncbi:MAG: hypothetical protein HKO66_03775 [Saprospiraceae bacterium]|nr:hypothetical protein [Bacteroidia bacterium]NNE15024.1 hypothetical protein [Saprospiraceae bacterium]NNL91332.1 hypothetical protein [Saprospiraceae bacterium]
MNRHKYILCCLVFAAFQCCAQELLPQTVMLDTVIIDFEEFNANQGLSAGNIRDVVQDHYGYLWIGTAAGLNRYDGYKVKEYLPVTGDSLGPPANYLIPELLDHNNNIWLRTNGKGQFIFNRKDETFHRVDIPDNAYCEFDSNRNLGWTYNKEWCIIDFDFVYDTKDSTRIVNTQKVCQPIQNYFKGLKHLPAKQIVRTKNNELWWIEKNDLHVYNLNYRNKTANLKFVKRKFITSKPIDFWSHTLVYDKNEDAIYLLEENQYSIIDIKTGNRISSKKFPKNFANPRFFLCDSKGRIWLLFGKHGLHRFDPKKATFTDIRYSKKSDVNMFSIRPASSIYEDKDQNIYIFSTAYGLYKYSMDIEKFNYYGNNNLGPSVQKLHLTKNDKLIFVEKGIVIYDYKKHKRTSKINLDLFNKEEYVTHRRVRIDDKGNIELDNVYLKNPEIQVRLNIKGEILEEKLKADVIKDIQANGYKIFSEKSFNWILWYEKNKNLNGDSLTLNLIKRDIISNKEIERYSFQTNVTYRSHMPVSEHTENIISLKSRNNGILLFDKKKKEFTQHYHDPNNINSLSSNQIYCTLTDPIFPDKVLWVGTANGLNRIDVTNNSYTHITKSNSALPNDVIYGILADDRQNLWMSTNNGLSLFDPKTSNFRNFSMKDGLQHTEFNTDAFIKSKDGTLFFGGVGGLTYFNPEDFYRDLNPSHVVIQALKLDNKKIEYERNPEANFKGFRLEAPLLETKEIKLPYFFRMISFEFACLDLTKASGNRFRYKLEGFDKEWVDLKHLNEVTFTNLDSGEYILRVQGSNHKGVWNEAGATMKLTILSAWWETWWFRLLCLTLILYGLYYFYNYRIKQNERIQSLRNRISQDLHDEIGSTLSSIALFGTVAQQNNKEGGPIITKMLNKINDSTIDVIESMNDIVWTISAENDKAINVINRMRAYISELTEATAWKIQIDYDDSIHKTDLSMIQRRNIYLVFKEAVNNAIKHSKGKVLTISLSKKAKKIILIIEDDGVGMKSNDEIEKFSLGGNGIKNMKRRAEELDGVLKINSQSGAGTTISLTCNLNVHG